MFKFYHERCLPRLQQHVGYHRGQPAPIPYPDRVMSLDLICGAFIASSAS